MRIAKTETGPERMMLPMASGSQDPNVPQNTLDGDLGTRWSQEGPGEWIT